MKCSECGCLAVWRSDGGGGGLQEATSDYREDGACHQFQPIPFCVMRRIDFRKIGERPELRTELKADRHCERFVLWVPGFSPKEHYQMFVGDELEAKMDKVRADDRTMQDKMYSVAWWSSLGAVVSMIISVLAFVVALATYMSAK